MRVSFLTTFFPPELVPGGFYSPSPSEVDPRPLEGKRATPLVAVADTHTSTHSHTHRERGETHTAGQAAAAGHGVLYMLHKPDRSKHNTLPGKLQHKSLGRSRQEVKSLHINDIVWKLFWWPHPTEIITHTMQNIWNRSICACSTKSHKCLTARALINLYVWQSNKVLHSMDLMVPIILFLLFLFGVFLCLCLSWHLGTMLEKSVFSL